MIYIGNQTACWAATPREPFDYAVASGFDAFEWFPDKKPNGGWDENNLDRWLANPDALVPDNDMSFRLDNAKERAAIVTYLKGQRR